MTRREQLIFLRERDRVTEIRERVGGGAASAEDWSLQCTENGANIDVSGGHLLVGEQAVAVGSESVEITGGTRTNPVYVYVRYSYAASTASIATTASATYPTPNESYWQAPLVSCYKSGPVAVIKRRLRQGDITVPIWGG